MNRASPLLPLYAFIPGQGRVNSTLFVSSRNCQHDVTYVCVRCVGTNVSVGTVACMHQIARSHTPEDSLHVHCLLNVRYRVCVCVRACMPLTSLVQACYLAVVIKSLSACCHLLSCTTCWPCRVVRVPVSRKEPALSCGGSADVMKYSYSGEKFT